jgi:hypothetical protein
MEGGTPRSSVLKAAVPMLARHNAHDRCCTHRRPWLARCYVFSVCARWQHVTTNTGGAPAPAQLSCVCGLAQHLLHIPMVRCVAASRHCTSPDRQQVHTADVLSDCFRMKYATNRDICVPTAYHCCMRAGGSLRTGQSLRQWVGSAPGHEASKGRSADSTSAMS